jgi:acyl-CoA synthetase (AMP-forming)/AMP-acid ligase II
MSEPFNLGDLADDASPRAIALIDLRLPAAPQIRTHGELDATTDAVAALLTRRGLPRGSAVAILSANRWEYVAAYFGIMRGGFIAVPVNIRFPPDTIAYILDITGVAFAFTDAAHAALPSPAIPKLNFDATPLPLAAESFATIRPEPDEIAQILFTSGSTGRPKGVPLSHAGQLWALAQMRKNTPAEPPAQTARAILAQPLFHMNGLMVTKKLAMDAASIVMLPVFNGRLYLEAIAAWGVNTVRAVPTMLARALKEADLVERLDLAAVRAVGVGSAPVTQALMERMKLAFPNAGVSNGYGTTEAGPSVFGPHPDGQPTPLLSVGYPLADAELKLVGGDTPEQGVLWMRNPAVMQGYLKLPEVSARVLVDGWYVSGDVFRCDANGFYYFVGRADDMFVCSGENIYPADVEKMLERHPAVHQVCVVPLPDEERGQMPVAFIVPRPGWAASVREIREFALANGPAYQHPRRTSFLAELPWAGTNKLDRAALIARARELERDGGWSA